MALTEQQRGEVCSMMDRYARMYRDRDLRGLVSLFSPSICGYGSGPDEVVRNASEMKVQLMRDLTQADAIQISFEGVHVDGEMPVAWVMADCAFEVMVKGQRLCMTGRITAVLKNTGARWRFEQIHFAIPAAGQATGESYPGSG